MNRFQPHPQARTTQQRPILRALMMGVAMCLLGFALFVQTSSILFVVGGAALGTLVTFNALRSRHRTQKPQASKPAPYKSAPPKRTASEPNSNVTPFRRPASKSSPDKSNRPSA